MLSRCRTGTSTCPHASGELGCTAPSSRIPGPAFQVVALRGYDPATMHGALVYNDTLWSHDCVGLRGVRLADSDDRDSAPG